MSCVIYLCVSVDLGVQSKPVEASEVWFCHISRLGNRTGMDCSLYINYTYTRVHGQNTDGRKGDYISGNH